MKVLIIVVGITVFLFLALVALLIQNIVFLLKRKNGEFSWALNYLFFSLRPDGLFLFNKKIGKSKKEKETKSEESEKAEEKQDKKKKEAEKDKKKDEKDEFTLSDGIKIFQERDLVWTVLKLVIRFLYDALTDFHIRVSEIEIWIGTGDPAYTGMITGWLYSTNRVKAVYPDFLNEKFDFSGELVIKYRPIMIFWRLIQLIWHLPKIRSYKLYKSLKGGKDGKFHKRDHQHDSGQNERNRDD